MHTLKLTLALSALTLGTAAFACGEVAQTAAADTSIVVAKNDKDKKDKKDKTAAVAGEELVAVNDKVKEEKVKEDKTKA